ncbi:MAG: hypothetical protein GTO63_37395 [Anaerolineae bacterium]|nr:hypothetical protein [Anaerolineae bacterium]NIO00439.1 hypothetical protein [Anaerolineae bacterium]NIQ83199.1 hypothetical protein [Anaerolineae bacterium]
MSGDYTNRAFSLTMVIPGAFSTGDGQACVRCPADAILMDVEFSIGTLGGTSGSTELMLRNDTDTLDMLASVSSIAYDADPKCASAASLHATEANRILDKGDVIEVDVDTVCNGAAEADLTVNVLLKGI